TINFNFPITLSGPSSRAVTVNFATADSTATEGSDYQASSGTLTFNPGETTKTISVSVKGDTVVESNELFFLNLSNPSNAVLARSQGIGTIINDDMPIITAEFSSSSYIVGEAAGNIA